MGESFLQPEAYRDPQKEQGDEHQQTFGEAESTDGNGS